jgi:hypothetical protein
MECQSNGSKDAEESFIVEEMNECRNRVAGSMPYLYRAVMLLCHFEGLSIIEVASAFNISPSAVKVRLHRGKQILGKSLNNVCDFYYDSNSNLRCSEKWFPSIALVQVGCHGQTIHDFRLAS